MIMSSLTWYVRRRFHELNTTKTLLLQVVCGCVKWQRMSCTVGPSLIFAASEGLLRALVSSDGLHQKHESQSDVELFYRLSAWAELTDAFLVGFLFPQVKTVTQSLFSSNFDVQRLCALPSFLWLVQKHLCPRPFWLWKHAELNSYFFWIFTKSPVSSIFY